MSCTLHVQVCRSALCAFQRAPPAPVDSQVEEIALLSTTLLRADGARLCWPNPKLAAEGLLNLSRSENRREAIRVSAELACKRRQAQGWTWGCCRRHSEDL